MLKSLAIIFGLLMICNSAQAQKIDIQSEVDNLNVIPIEKKIEMRQHSNKLIDVRVKHSRPGALRDLVKNSNQINKRNALDNKKEIPKDKVVDVKNQKAMKGFLKDQITTDTDGPDFFEGKEY